MFKRVSGTKDILPEETGLWQDLEQISRNVFSAYNYREIRTPIIEDISLFTRSLGESTEIVQKQMFQITAKSDTYCLRPEGTAAIVRAYIENNLDKKTGFAKLYYIGPMFRFERPQKGRLRQFHHIGCEAIGSSGPDIDIEILSLADFLLKKYSVGGYKIKINSLGCNKDKQGLTEILKKGLADRLNSLCPDCRMRFQRNVLRILDCKNKTCQDIISRLGIEQGYLCQECGEHFSRVKEGLDLLNIEYEVSPYLVRGLDYYTRTVFEIKHSALGAQDALGAGGRYDNLVAELGGANIGAMGFAFGIERVLLAKEQSTVSATNRGEISPNWKQFGGHSPQSTENRNLVYLITLGEAAKLEGLKLLNQLRKEGVACDTDYENKSLKGSMRCANDLKAKYAVIIGENEIRKKILTLKDMITGEQKEVTQADILKEIKC